jgi:hypothetical protein
MTLPTVALCREVKGYGIYEPIEPLRFAAGREHPVILYCEVKNFSSHLNERAMWETRLAEQVLLFDDTGVVVWPADPDTQTIVDVCRNRRSDFFSVMMIRLPGTLKAGRYHLKVSVVDQHVRRVAEETLAIEIEEE